MTKNSGAREWLRGEDSRTLNERADRAEDVARLFPMTGEGMITFGGLETGVALIECRLTYVSGLYLSTVLTALTVLERHFAGVLYAKGIEKAKRMAVEDLFKRAERERLLTGEEAAEFDQFRLLRNAYAHFRDPSHELSGLRRSMTEGLPLDELLHRDARAALKMLGSHFGRQPFPEVRLYPDLM
jgi:hypothetical protein